MYRFDAFVPVLLRPGSTSETSNPAVASPHPDVQLWQRAASGDWLALRDIYRAHHQHVRAFAQRLLGDVQAAEDLVQEVFIAVPKAAKNFRQETSPSTYLLGIAANHARNHIRSAKRRRAASERLATRAAVGAPSAQPNPEEAANATQLVERLMTAVDELPDKLRIVFVLCQVEERDATEVSTILGIPPATVRSRLQAARARIQNINSWSSPKELT